MTDALNAEHAARYFYVGLVNKLTAMGFHGFAKFFTHQAREEQAHIEQITDYLVNVRGFSVPLLPIPALTLDTCSPLQYLNLALDKERAIAESIQALISQAVRHGDKHLEMFLVAVLLDAQLKSITELSRHIDTLKSLMSDVLMVWVYDLYLKQLWTPPSGEI